MVRPYRHAYDGIIVHYMMKESMRSFLEGIKQKQFKEVPVGLHETYVPLPKSFTELYHVIRTTDPKKGGNPTVSRTTIRRHLNRMVKERVLEKHPKIDRKYRLSTRKMMAYFVLIIETRKRHPKEKFFPSRFLGPQFLGPIARRLYVR